MSCHDKYLVVAFTHGREGSCGDQIVRQTLVARRWHKETAISNETYPGLLAGGKVLRWGRRCTGSRSLDQKGQRFFSKAVACVSVRMHFAGEPREQVWRIDAGLSMCQYRVKSTSRIRTLHDCQRRPSVVMASNCLSRGHKV
jgi:hypothetical protein